MKQNNIEKLIEWMDKEIKSEDIKYPTFIAVYNKAKQLQREEPIMYTQEEMDKACKDAFKDGYNSFGA